MGGVDRAMFGYFASKLGAERVVAESGLPWTTLRATQFHDLMLTTVEQMARLPVIPVPAGFRFQPVDADEVAARLVELALGTAGRAWCRTSAGPGVRDGGARPRYLQARGKHRLIVPVGSRERRPRAFRAGANLAPDRAVADGPGRSSWPTG